MTDRISHDDPIVTSLKQLVARQLDQRWDAFAAEHPHLAGAVARVQLVETVVHELRDDPEFQRAMEAAGRDEAVLAAAAEIAGLVDRWVVRLLGL